MKMLLLGHGKRTPSTASAQPDRTSITRAVRGIGIANIAILVIFLPIAYGISDRYWWQASIGFLALSNVVGLTVAAELGEDHDRHYAQSILYSAVLILGMILVSIASLVLIFVAMYGVFLSLTALGVIDTISAIIAGAAMIVCIVIVGYICFRLAQHDVRAKNILSMVLRMSIVSFFLLAIGLAGLNLILGLFHVSSDYYAVAIFYPIMYIIEAAIFIAACYTFSSIIVVPTVRSWIEALAGAWEYLVVMGKSIAGYMLGYLLITLWFTGCFVTIYRLDNGQFKSGPSPLTFLDFLFFAVMTFPPLGYSDIRPTSGLSEILVSMNSLIGVGWTVVVFAAIVGRAQKAWETLGPVAAPNDNSQTGSLSSGMASAPPQGATVDPSPEELAKPPA
jgi:hypothetical protein